MNVLFQHQCHSTRRTEELTGSLACWPSGRLVRMSSRPRCWCSTATSSTVTMISLHMVPFCALGIIKEILLEDTASWQSSLWEDILPMSVFQEVESSQLTSRKATRKLESYLTVITATTDLATQSLIHSEIHGKTTSGSKHFQKQTSLHQMHSPRIIQLLSHNNPPYHRILKRKRMKRNQKMTRIKRILLQPKHRHHLWVKNRNPNNKPRRLSKKSKSRFKSNQRSSKMFRKIKLLPKIRPCS